MPATSLCAAASSQVLAYAVRRSPDFPEKNPPRISEHTRRAINAAGGLDYLRECRQEDLQWARKRFLEEYVRYAELGRDEYLLPPGEVRDLLAEFAETKALPASAESYEDARVRGEAYRSQLASQGPPSLSPEERLSVADELAAAARKVLEHPCGHVIVVSDEGRTALRQKTEAIKRSFR